MAFKKSGLSAEEIKKINSEDWTWHHLDDFDPVTGECTMQLVRSDAHQFTVTHLGGAGLYKAYKGIGYPNRTKKK